jgi:Ni,Fe-hydrogenase I cytochrome b subunit
MMSAFARVRELLSAELRQIAPPSVGFWQILGGLTLFLLFLEITTGILLMVYYRPSADEAYESVFYIINDVQLGWLIHGMHRWGAQLFILLVLVHLIRVYFAEAYRERELNWVIGVVLLLVVGAFAFTGTLLVWDQRAFWGTDAVRRVLAEIPIVGRAILYFLWGGTELDANALLRFYVFHVGLLPWIAIGLVMVHLYLVSRQGIFHRAEAQETAVGANVRRYRAARVDLRRAELWDCAHACRDLPRRVERSSGSAHVSERQAPVVLSARLRTAEARPKAAGVALASLGVLGLFAAPWLGRNSWVAWGLGMLGIATVALLAAYGWRW